MFDALHRKDMTGTEAGSALDVRCLPSYSNVRPGGKPAAEIAPRSLCHTLDQGPKFTRSV
jgi:hypothetical protein